MDSAVGYTFELESTPKHKESQGSVSTGWERAVLNSKLSMGKLTLLKRLLMHLKVYLTSTVCFQSDIL